MLFPFLNERAWMRVALRKSATRDRRDFLFACVINAGKCKYTDLYESMHAAYGKRGECVGNRRIICL